MKQFQPVYILIMEVLCTLATSHRSSQAAEGHIFERIILEKHADVKCIIQAECNTADSKQENKTAFVNSQVNVNIIQISKCTYLQSLNKALPFFVLELCFSIEGIDDPGIAFIQQEKQ